MFGDELNPQMLKVAYREGWFPMTTDEESNLVEWFQPHYRCLFPIKGVHVSKSLRKRIRQGGFRLTFNQDFANVMRGCLREPGDNWISEDFIRVYSEAHQEGWAHSAEIWIDECLVAGVYGLQVGKIFCAESMFHRKTDMSKIALAGLVDVCRHQGIEVFDAQILNSHLESLGAFTIPAEEYDQLLEKYGKDESFRLDLTHIGEYDLEHL